MPRHRQRLGELPDYAVGGGERRQLVGRAILVPAEAPAPHAAGGRQDGDRGAARQRRSARASLARIRPTHVFLPDFQVVLRNVLALLWLRARGVRVVMRLGNAPAPGRFYRLLWRYGIDPFVDCFVCNSEFTRRELVALDIDAEQSDHHSEHADGGARRRGVPTAPRMPGRIIFVGQIIPEKGLDVLLDAVALLRARSVTGDARRGRRHRRLGVAGLSRPPGVAARAGGARRSRRRREFSRLARGRPRPDGRVRACTVVRAAWNSERRSATSCSRRRCLGMPSVVTMSGDLAGARDAPRQGWVCAEITPAALAEGLEYFLTRPDRARQRGPGRAGVGRRIQ